MFITQGVNEENLLELIMFEFWSYNDSSDSSSVRLQWVQPEVSVQYNATDTAIHISRVSY